MFALTVVTVSRSRNISLNSNVLVPHPRSTHRRARAHPAAIALDCARARYPRLRQNALPKARQAKRGSKSISLARSAVDELETFWTRASKAVR